MSSIRKAIPFLGGGYKASSVNFDANRCVNFYLETDEDGKTPLALYGTPGTLLFSVLPGGGANRPNGLHVTFDGRLFACKGNRLYEIFSDSSVIERGILLTSTGPVFMNDNGAANDIKGNQMLITDTFVYVYDFGTNVLTQVTQFVDGFGTPTGPIVNLLSSTFQDGYGIATEPETQNVFVTNLYDFTKWEALDVALQEGNPDKVVGCLSNGQDLGVWGTTSTEFWYDSGAGTSADGTAFPFQRRQGGLLNVGTSSISSIALLESSFYWLGGGTYGQGKIFRSKGDGYERVSTHPIETYITSLDDVSTAFGFAQEWRGHLFYFITFPSAENGLGKTFVYDAANGSWHERSFLDITTGYEGRHLAASHVFCFGKHYISDYRNGNIFLWDENTYTDNGTPLVSRRDGYHISDNEDLISCREFQVVLQSGTGVATGQGYDPQGMLRVSRDGGHTWSHQITAPIGKQGEYKSRCMFRRLGTARDFVFSFSISDPVKRVIIKAVAQGPNGPF